MSANVVTAPDAANAPRVALQKRGRLQREQPGDHHILRIGPQCTRAHWQARPRLRVPPGSPPNHRPANRTYNSADHDASRAAAHPTIPRHPDAGHARSSTERWRAPSRTPDQQHRQHLQRESLPLARRVRQQGDHASQAPALAASTSPHARITPYRRWLPPAASGKRRACARAEEQGRRQQRGQQSGALFQRMRDRRIHGT